MIKMKKLYHYLYKVMCDDLKDADMLIDYACKMKEEECHEAAKFFTECAVYRLSKSFKEANALFEAHKTKESGFSNDSVTHDLWKVRHEEMMEEYDELCRKVERLGK